MRKYLFVAILSSLVLFTMTTGLSGLVTSSSDSWTTGGPYGGYINSLAMAGTNPDVIYAGTESGLFKTVDGGDTWTGTGFPNTLVRVVQVAPGNPNTVYAGTDDGIYKSEDGGSIWTQKGLSGARVNAIAIDPGNPLTLYAGTGWPNKIISGEIVAIFKSTDGGEIWEDKYSEPAEDAIMALLVDADDSSYIYAGTNGGYGSPLGRSIDGGDTWFGKPIGADSLVALAMTPAGSDQPAIYAVGDDDVYKSTDSGDSWTPTYIPFTSETSPLAVDPNNPNTIYVGSRYYQGNLFKSTDGGDNWSIKANGLPTGGVPSSIVIDPRNSAIHFGLSEGGVYKSTDGAESWSFSSQGMNNTYINDLAVHPTSSGTVFAAVKGRGHYLTNTTNGGTSWDYLSDSPTDRGAVAIDPQTPSTMYAGFGWRGRSNQVYSLDKSINGGQGWTSTGNLFSTIGYHYVGVSDIWVSPSDSTTILVAVAGEPQQGDGIYRSADGGATWEQPRAIWATTLAADPTNDQILYFGT